MLFYFLSLKKDSLVEHSILQRYGVNPHLYHLNSTYDFNLAVLAYRSSICRLGIQQAKSKTALQQTRQIIPSYKNH